MKKRTEKRLNNVQAYACVCVAAICACSSWCTCSGFGGNEALISASVASNAPSSNAAAVTGASGGNSAAYAAF